MEGREKWAENESRATRGRKERKKGREGGRKKGLVVLITQARSSFG